MAMIKRRELLKIAGVSAALLPLGLSGALAESQPKKIFTRPIPSTGEPLPVIGFGQSAAFRGDDQTLTNTLLDILLDMGGRFVDTAGSAQQRLGAFMTARNDHEGLFLGTNLFGENRFELMHEMAKSKKIQGKNPLDLVQLRSPENLDKQWHALLDLKEAGMTKYLGFATARKSYYPAVMKLIKTGKLDFAQINYSILEPGVAERLLPMAQDHGVAIITNRPFLNGKYFPLVHKKPLPAWAAEFDCSSWAQFSLKYILSHPAVNCVLTESANPKHALDNLSAGIGRLPDEDTRKRMSALMATFN